MAEKNGVIGGDRARSLLDRLEGWKMSDDGKTISRRFEFKGFAKAVQMANVAAWLGDRNDHHPDIAFGWGYCTVSFTTHDAGGLTEKDFDCAGKLDQLTA